MNNSGPTKMFSFASGLFGFYIEDISTSGWPGPDPQPDPPDGTVLTYVYYTSRSYYEAGGHVFVYMADEDDDGPKYLNTPETPVPISPV